MLGLSGRAFRLCDGTSRRNFLQLGSLGIAGLSLSDLLKLRSEASAEGTSLRKTSVIFLELAGGPTQFETYDPKPLAPVEYRGEFGVTQTVQAGVQFCELMGQQATVMDKLAIVRSITHDSNSHDPSSHLTQTGYYKKGPKGGPAQMPCIGSVAARLRGANVSGIPPYVSIPHIMRNGGPAYLGKGFRPFETNGDPNKKDFEVRNLTLTAGLEQSRLDQRRQLLASLDESRRVLGTNQVAESMDEFTRQAFEMVTGDRARSAFDLDKETEVTRDRYGRTTFGQSMLLARRLVEAGVTFVSVRVGGWDDHNKIVSSMKAKGPAFDHGVAALVHDIYERGLDQDVLIVAMGEFGRTPRVNANAGRDHWGAVMSVLLSGGGLAVGQVIGASNGKGEVPTRNSYRPENVLAMVYRHLGIDPKKTFDDRAGRPRYLLETSEVMEELL